MAEYIERDKFIHFLFKEIAYFTETGQDTEIPVSSVLQSVVNELNKFETADVQPVVRCKDCQYWQESRYGIIEMNACLRFDSPLEKDGFIFKANAEDFCSFAKRRAET